MDQQWSAGKILSWVTSSAGHSGSCFPRMNDSRITNTGFQILWHSVSRNKIYKISEKYYKPVLILLLWSRSSLQICFTYIILVIISPIVLWICHKIFLCVLCSVKYTLVDTVIWGRLKQCPVNWNYFSTRLDLQSSLSSVSPSLFPSWSV